MKQSRLRFPMVDEDGEYTPRFEAEFAAYLTRLEADLDHPENGEDAREMLAMDREELRDLFAFSVAIEAGQAPMSRREATVYVVVTLALCALSVWYTLW
jgi:hypothetical protein